MAEYTTGPQLPEKVTPANSDILGYFLPNGTMVRCTFAQFFDLLKAKGFQFTDPNAPVVTPATATLSANTSSVNAGSTVTLNYAINMGTETSISGRQLQRRAAGSTGTWETINGPGSNNGSFTYTPTESSEFRYRFVSESGEKFSGVVTVNYVVAANTAPTTPQNVTVSNITSTSATLSWSASTDDAGVTGYNIYIEGVKQNPSPVNALTYNLSGLTPETEYNPVVRAVDANGLESAIDPGQVPFFTTLAEGATNPAPTNLVTNEADNTYTFKLGTV